VTIPESIEIRYNQLVELCEEYPLKIPLDKAAKFLNMEEEGLRSSIEQGRCQFGLCVQKNKNANRAFTINTIAFYSWVTGGAVFKTLVIEKLDEKTRKHKIINVN
jgi:hypothetical protein